MSNLQPKVIGLTPIFVITSKILIVFLSFLFLTCDQQIQCNQLCVNVKLIKELCGQAILEILDPAYFDHGQSWQDGNGVEYKNVLSTLLPCNFSDNFGNGSGVLQPGQEFHIQFTEALHDVECARCKALLDGPEKFSNVKVVEPCAKQEEE